MEEAGDNFLLPFLKQLCHNLSASNAVEGECFSLFRSLLVNRFPNSFTNSNVRIQELDDSMEEDDEDGPIVLSTEDFEAALARSSSTNNSSADSSIPMDIRQAYPLLVAATMHHQQEDILMACARILDEKTDVSLVREAAAYLEEVEQRK